ncbi:protein kinase [Myxococcota bacterium]|nr:protein kinase [Myxococcota bacterium]
MKAKFGRYIFLKKLAVGGMAEVYLARRISFGGFAKFVVIKRLLPEHKGKPAYERLFLAEARTGAVLNHPNIVGLHDLGKLDDHYFMAMEFVDGVSAADVMARAAKARKPIPLGAALRIAAGVADALFYAHHTLDEHGEPLRIIHHDITPQNIQISFEGDVKLLDFGVATRMGRPVAGGRRGKPGYMSPEALRKGMLDARSDLYSLGVVLYELTTGRRIGKPQDPTMPLEKIERIEIPTPTRLDPYFPPSLEEIILPCLAETPEERPADAGALARLLHEAGRKLGFDMSAAALAAYLRDLLGDELGAHRAQLADLARKSDPVRRAEGTSAAPPPTDSSPGERAHPPEPPGETAPRDVPPADDALVPQVSGEFDAQNFEDPALLPDIPPEAVDDTPAPPPPAQTTTAAAGPAAGGRGRLFAAALVVGAAALVAGRFWGAAAARAEAAAVGSLEVETTPPGARVFDGDRLLGIAPFRDPRAPVGHAYALKIVLDGHAPWQGEIALTPDRPHRSLALELKPAP